MLQDWADLDVFGPLDGPTSGLTYSVNVQVG